MHREIGTLGFVLRSRPYGESDRIVTLITEEHGKITGIAKGAKNSRRRFGGTLEPFLHVRIVFRQRPASELVFLEAEKGYIALRCWIENESRIPPFSIMRTDDGGRHWAPQPVESEESGARFIADLHRGRPSIASAWSVERGPGRLTLVYGRPGGRREVVKEWTWLEPAED